MLSFAFEFSCSLQADSLVWVRGKVLAAERPSRKENGPRWWLCCQNNFPQIYTSEPVRRLVFLLTNSFRVEVLLFCYLGITAANAAGRLSNVYICITPQTTGPWQRDTQCRPVWEPLREHRAWSWTREITRKCSKCRWGIKLFTTPRGICCSLANLEWINSAVAHLPYEC